MRIVRDIVVVIFVLLIGESILAQAAAWSAEPQTDLYRVYIHSQKEADLLASLPVDPVWRLGDGYLVLAYPNVADRVISSGLRCELIFTGVDRRALVLDRRIDLPEDSRFDVIFQQGGTRICRVNPGERADRTVAARFFPIQDEAVPIGYRPPLKLDKSVTIPTENLDSLASRVQEDSIVSYSEFLQSLDGRLTMTSGTLAARNWLIDKFREFGYDSVVIDTFTGPGRFEYDFVTGHNVIAYKIGTENPYHHIIIGAHYDAGVDMDDDVSLSPGADDNGSGVVAVMEIARALKNIDTRQTIEFVLFDAEEEGLVGSTAHARRAAQYDDRIVLALNMDMIGHYENENDAHIYWSMDSTAAQIWTSLAQTIPGLNLTGHSAQGSMSSDDAAYAQAGYPTLGVHEFIFSTVYHSYQDSTTYLNFDYLTRMTRACLATAYVFDQQFVPDYELWMTFPPDMSELIVPHVTTNFNLLVREYGGARLIPGSIFMHYSMNGGDEVTIPMAAAGDDLYTAEMPPFQCLDAINYYATAEEESLGQVFYPGEDETRVTVVATSIDTIFYDGFDSDQGWTVVSETFAGEWQMHASMNDYDGTMYYYYASSYWGVYDGTTSLISPIIDIGSEVSLVEYARWCTNVLVPGTTPEPDYLKVYIRNGSGGPWIPVETIEAVQGNSGNWQVASFRVGDFLPSAQTVQLKFDATEYGRDSYLIAAVDAVRLTGFGTDIQILTENVPSWTAFHPYTQQLEAAVCADPVMWTDRFGQLEGTGLTLSEDGLLSGIPTRLGPVVFRALATDQLGGYDEQILSLIIYDTLRVTTATIPATATGESYSSQLRVSGGTGTKTWSDRDGDLAETGITLSSTGLLSGIPISDGDFPFTALVTDQVGATTEKAFTLHIVGPYICGDASGDSTVDISDAVYVINYIFKNGAPPYPLEAGDANADGAVDVGDAVYLIEFIFKSGSAPQCP